MDQAQVARLLGDAVEQAKIASPRSDVAAEIVAGVVQVKINGRVCVQVSYDGGGEFKIVGTTAGEAFVWDKIVPSELIMWVDAATCDAAAGFVW